MIEPTTSNTCDTNDVTNDDTEVMNCRKNIDAILEKEATRNTKENWSKLDKTTKVNKLTEFANRVAEERKLTPEDATNLGKYLADALERKRLSSVKDVVYDNETGEINKIPSLTFSSTSTRKYTLKRVEKRASTLKSLGTGKGKRKIY